MAGEGFQIGQALGASLASTVTQGVAQWRQIQLERQQQKEFEGGIALYNQRTLASRQAINPEPQKLLSAYQQQWQRYPQSQIEQRPTGEVGEDGQAVTESVIRTPEGDIPLAQLNQLKASKQQTEIGLTLADMDALAELQARYPNNPKVRQFVANTTATINQKWQLKFKAQEQAGLEQARQLSAYQIELDRQKLQEQKRQFDAGPQRQAQQAQVETDQGIRRDQARITAEQEKEIAVEGVKAQNKPEKAPSAEQSKAATFGRRVEQALGEFKSIDYDRTALSAGAESMLPNVAKPEGLQRMEQAERNFLNAVLRKESGALISPSEFENGEKQYFPRAGDKPETVKQKARNRQLALEGLKAEAGGAFAQVPAGSTGATGGLSEQEQALIDAVKAGKMTKEQARAQRAALRGQ